MKYFDLLCPFVFFFFNEAVDIVTEERTAAKSKDTRQKYFTQNASATTEMFSYSTFHTTAQKFV